MAISFDTESAAAMQKALAASSLRQQVLSNNIANVNTPNFKRSDVLFGEELQQAVEQGEKRNGNGRRLELKKTNAKHLPVSGNSSAEAKIVNEASTTMRTDGNNVDIDREMAEVAKNSIFYQANAQQLSRYYATLKSVITGGR